ncbi:MAG: hypothetical protein M3Q94_09975 [Pseudomonadota bacterium]|nr:hypothetical protein [Pseudomonadota bacterium]
MNISIRTPALSMQADGYLIKNPQQTKNAHTITDVKNAVDVLKLTNDSLISDLKELIRGVDFTSISTNELARIGGALGRMGLVDKHVACSFISGNMAVDKFGQQTEKDVKYNAVAMFDEMLEDNKAYARAWPMYANQESFKLVTMALLGANQVVNALSFFAHSNGDDLSISIRV